MRNFVLALIAMMLVAPLAQAYTDYSLTVKVMVKPDGTAHVNEKTVVYMDSKEEIDAFNNNLRLGKSTILDWKKFSENIRYHVGGTQGAIENLSITAGPEYTIGERARSITLDYDLASQIVNVTSIGSRTTHYALREDMLGFELSEVRQIILGNNIALSVDMPTGANIVKQDGTPQVGPAPYRYDTAANRVTWSGPMTGKWTLVFEVEEPLSNEVYAYFSNAYKQLLAALPIALTLVLFGVILSLLFKMRRA